MIEALVQYEDTLKMRNALQFAFDIVCVGLREEDGGGFQDSLSCIKAWQRVLIPDDELQEWLMREWERNPKHPPRKDNPYRITVKGRAALTAIPLQSDRQIRLNEMPQDDLAKILNPNIAFRRIEAHEVRTTMSRT